MNIYLDDKRLPSQSHNIAKGLGFRYSYSGAWLILRNFQDFTRIIDEDFNKIGLISFDHDLACFDPITKEELTGLDAVDYVIAYCLENDKKFPDWYAHTDNSVGRENIIGRITNYLKVVEKKNMTGWCYWHRGILKTVFV